MQQMPDKLVLLLLLLLLLLYFCRNRAKDNIWHQNQERSYTNHRKRDCRARGLKNPFRETKKMHRNLAPAGQPTKRLT